MKNIIKKSWLALFFVGFMTTSCLDALEIRQKGEATEEIVYETIEDLQIGLNTVYLNYLPDANGNGVGDAIWFSDIFTDNTKRGASNAGQGLETYLWNLQSQSDTADRIWRNRYATINFVNRALRASERIEQNINNQADQDRFNDLKAQFLALRAICHYDVFMYYTTNYTDSNALSAIKMDYVPETSDKPVRNNVGEIVDFIFEDLNNARSLITSATNDPFRINLDVIDAFRAKLSLAIADYNTAGTIAEQLLTKYPLANKTDYINLFEDLGTAELIFGLKRVEGNNSIAGCWYNVATNAQGAPWFEMSEQLYNLYMDGDVRIDNVLLDATSDIPNKMFLIDKYPGQPGNNLLNDVKLVRSSEMALILAETQARNGDFVASATTLQSLIDIRYAPSIVPTVENVSYSNLNDALNRILRERRKELCFEGHRYLDLKRFGVGINRLESDAKTFTSNAPTDMISGDYRFTLPIPQAEIRGNRNVTQNPGYTNN